ncbi:MAG: NADH:ubiquinone reductase (Na(+)-transporting) subunit F [Gemmatimonadales bacterium]
MAVYIGVILALVCLILIARSKLVYSGPVRILINNEKTIQVPAGNSLLTTLANAELFIPAPCGGKGSCGQCRLKVFEGGGSILPTERSLITRREARQKVRLACQVMVREDMKIQVHDDVFGVRKWTCRVVSNRNVATFIKETVLELPPGEEMEFRAGGYIQLECPPHEVRYRDFDIEDEYRSEWDRYGLWRYESVVKKRTMRAYSMANHPGEKDVIILNVRIATPPPDKPKAPPGIVSSYIFGLKPGDEVVISGPYGEFFARDTDKEMVFVGGGAGMAPMRSHILDQLKRLHTKRKITFWYGARSRREMFYVEDFDRLESEHENFQWLVALSDPKPEDMWQGHTGFIHEVLYELYVIDHPEPDDCEYYLCGPPLMNAAVIKMLEDNGVDRDNIMLDDFGG